MKCFSHQQSQDSGVVGVAPILEMVRKKGQLKVLEIRAQKLREQLSAAEKIVLCKPTAGREACRQGVECCTDYSLFLCYCTALVIALNFVTVLHWLLHSSLLLCCTGYYTHLCYCAALVTTLV